MAVLRPGISNKMSRIPEPQPWISFVLVWTHKSNITLRRNNFVINRLLLISSCVTFGISDLLFEMDITKPTVYYVTEIRRGFRIAYFDSHNVYLVCLRLKEQW
jgi:hypothetical protein